MQQAQPDPWQFVEIGWYEQAIKLYTRYYKEDGSIFHLTNRGTVYLLQGNYDAALMDFQQVLDVEEPRFQADNHYFFLGICYWHLKQPLKAVDVWRLSLTVPYTDAAGGVEAPALLLYAALRLDDPCLREEAMQALRQHAQARLMAWPGPIVPFLLGEMDATAFVDEADATSSDTLRARQACQADFYVALRALLDGNKGGFQARMIECTQTPYKILEHEYYIARWEVEHGFPDPAAVYPGGSPDT